MEKAQVELFRAIRSGDLVKARKAYEKGANVNWPLDRWMMNGKQHWGLRVQVKPLGIYLGFSAREAWMVPNGEGADRGDTLIMIALKCRMSDAVAFLVGCDRLNPNCRNEAGNTAADIARATGQEFLMRGGGVPPQGAGVEYEEALPAWEQGTRPAAVVDAGGGGGAVGQDGVIYASVVTEAVPVEPTAPPAAGGGALYATAEPVGDVAYAQSGHATVAHVHVVTPIQPNSYPVGHGGQQQTSYNPVDGGGRANGRHGAGRGGRASMGTPGTGLYGAF